MADNYLEKKMEEHRNGGSHTPYRQKLTPRGTRPGEWVLSFTPCHLFIEDIADPRATDLARAMAALGFKVCFTHSDPHTGSRLASTLGASFLPAGMPRPDDTIILRITSGGLQLSRFGVTLEVSDSPKDSAVWSAVMLANFNSYGENMLRNIKISAI